MSTSPKKQLLRMVVDLPPGEAVEAILAWVEEVIGPEDVVNDRPLYKESWEHKKRNQRYNQRNELRAEQHQRLYGGGE